MEASAISRVGMALAEMLTNQNALKMLKKQDYRCSAILVRSKSETRRLLLSIKRQSCSFMGESWIFGWVRVAREAFQSTRRLPIDLSGFSSTRESICQEHEHSIESFEKPSERDKM